MVQYTIYVSLQDKIYQTNVIANKNQSEEEVYKIAKEQVMKQWIHLKNPMNAHLHSQSYAG
ncbi:BA3454 family stress response protein [Niallia sp. XMNu-256]|uniref:BA3454 family stress response protein n=1 Tax=Niallia sp. XMNu-256 TaxID=3082444 RepID=UPI0030CEA1DE